MVGGPGGREGSRLPIMYNLRMSHIERSRRDAEAKNIEVEGREGS